MKKSLIIGIILLILCLGLVIYHEFINGPINIHEITNTGSKEKDVRVYLDATFVAGTITGNEEKSFYVMFGDGVQYIVNISNSKAHKINQFLLDNPESSYRIEGVTKLIPSTMEEPGKKFAKEWLDHSHNHEEKEENHSHDVTTEDFYHYFGYVYLDTTTGLDLIRLFIYLTGSLGVLFVINYFNSKYHFIGNK